MARKGFTLIELLIVIAIIGILAAAVVVVLNPAELLAQARDGQRLSDVDAINSGINLYIASTSSPKMYEAGATGSSTQTMTASSTTGCPFVLCGTVSTSTVTDGTGWVRVKLDDVAGGSPLPVLPMDPTNNGSYFYAYAGSNSSSTFEVATRLESVRHRSKMTADGGNDNTCASFTGPDCFYEKGTEPGLDF